ncbi:FAH1 [Scenedesmus sp. PABB004]|nr:FAH1 [Scenedesmus sp. PABB004]
MAGAARAAGSERPAAPDAAAPPDDPDPAAPLVAAVGRLGPRYWAWVHRPLPGAPRFFASPLLENLTRCPWWVVPLLWLPAWAALCAAAVSRHGLRPAQLAAAQLAGVALWQALEYAIHRWLFHARVSSAAGITLHFLFHGNHHKFPKDAARLVFPPLPAAAIAGGIYGALRAALPPPAATALMAGVVLGYVAYDCLHYAMHHAGARALRWGLLAELRARHAAHHYADHGAGFGISSTLFDLLLGTRGAA